MDKSAPKGASVNDGIDGSLTSLKYIGVEECSSALSTYAKNVNCVRVRSSARARASA